MTTVEILMRKLDDARRSLVAISQGAGKDENLLTSAEIRQFAANRAREAALDGGLVPRPTFEQTPLCTQCKVIRTVYGICSWCTNENAARRTSGQGGVT